MEKFFCAPTRWKNFRSCLANCPAYRVLLDEGLLHRSERPGHSPDLL
ncbi:MAG: hypothetical protein OJF52_002932 [Nitrospira sp.]|nr:MAG: hypothetical protein OJF52_002932 [Nitrospira sp.]